jgi:hypothetical protein
VKESPRNGKKGTNKKKKVKTQHEREENEEEGEENKDESPEPLVSTVGGVAVKKRKARK